MIIRTIIWKKVVYRLIHEGKRKKIFNSFIELMVLYDMLMNANISNPDHDTIMREQKRQQQQLHVDVII